MAFANPITIGNSTIGYKIFLSRKEIEGIDKDTLSLSDVLRDAKVPPSVGTSITKGNFKWETIMKICGSGVRIDVMINPPQVSIWPRGDLKNENIKPT